MNHFVADHNLMPETITTSHSERLKPSCISKVEEALQEATRSAKAMEAELAITLQKGKDSGLGSAYFLQKTEGMNLYMRELAEQNADFAALEVSYNRNIADAFHVIDDHVASIRNSLRNNRLHDGKSLAKMLAGNGQLTSENASQVTQLLVTEHDTKFLQILSKLEAKGQSNQRA